MKTGWIQIASSGWQTDVNGVSHYFSPERFRWIAAQYRPAWHEAPAVVGHPEMDDPAYGWASEVRERDGFLEARFIQMPKKFYRWAVKDGRMKKRSIALFPDGTLRHIGFLGAVPPAMKGLKNVEFSDNHFFTYFQEDAMASKKALKREIDSLRMQLHQQGGQPPNFAGQGMANHHQTLQLTEEKAEEKARRKAAEAKVKSLQTKISETSSQSPVFASMTDDQRGKIEKRIDKAIKEGKVMPAARGELVAFASVISAGPDQAFSIDGRDKLSCIDHFWNHIDSLSERSIFFQYSDDYAGGDGEDKKTGDGTLARAREIAGAGEKGKGD